MINPYSSDVVASHKSMTLRSGEPAQVLTLVNENALLVSRNSLVLYKSVTTVDDALGNGLIDSVSLPEEFLLAEKDGEFVTIYQAGFVGLQDDKAILITPNNVRLYPTKADALANKNQIVQLEFVS